MRMRRGADLGCPQKAMTPRTSGQARSGAATPRPEQHERHGPPADTPASTEAPSAEPHPAAAADPPGTRAHRTLPRPCRPHTGAITPVHDGSSPSFSASRRAQDTPRHRGLAEWRATSTDGHSALQCEALNAPSRVPGTLGGDARSVLGRDRRVISADRSDHAIFTEQPDEGVIVETKHPPQISSTLRRCPARAARLLGRSAAVELPRSPPRWRWAPAAGPTERGDHRGDDYEPGSASLQVEIAPEIEGVNYPEDYVGPRARDRAVRRRGDRVLDAHPDRSRMDFTTNTTRSTSRRPPA